MRFGKVLCGITAATVILGSMTAMSNSEILQAEAATTNNTTITEGGITYVMNSDRTLTILAFPDVDVNSWSSLAWLAERDPTVTAIKVDPKVSGFFTKDGVLFAGKEDDATLVAYPAGKKDTTYSIPDGVTEICAGAFNMASIEILNIPASVKYISDSFPGSWNPINMFYGLDNLKQINVDSKNTVYYSSDGALYKYSDWDGERALARYPFGRSGGDFIVPDGVSDLTNLAGADLDSLYIPVSVKTSPEEFTAKDVYYAGNETQFKKIEGGVYVDEPINLYNYCKEKGINVHYNVKAPSKTDSKITYKENEDGTLTASVAESARKTITSLTIPETVNGKKVTVFTMIESEYDAGYGPTYNGYTLPELKSLSLPASLTDVKLCESEDPLMPKLTEIKVNSKNPVLYVKDNVLFKKHDKGITMLLYPSGKKNISYTIPEGVTDSDFRLSLRNDFLKTLKFPSTLADIGDTMSQGAGRPLYEGYYTANVSEINVDPKNKTFASVDGNLYSKDMAGLIKYFNKDAKTYIVPDTIEFINAQEFYGDTIYIPKSVGWIHCGFLNSDNVKDVYYAGSEEEWRQITPGTNIPMGTMTMSDFTRGTIHFNTPAPTAAPEAPTKPSSSGVTSKGVTLTWGKVDGATAYIIKYSLDGGKTWTTRTVTTNSIILSGLKPNTSYIYKIAAKNGKTESPFTPDYKFKTKDDDSEPTSDPTSDSTQSGDENVSDPTSNPTSDPTSDPTKPGDESNPSTGAVALVPVLMLSGAAVIVAKKRKK